LPIGEAASGRVCACSLRSRLVYKLDQETWLCRTHLVAFWFIFNHIGPIWIYLDHSVFLDQFILTLLFGPVYLYLSIWIRLFGPVYLDLL
jgi:hypothetical protein